MGSVVFVVCVCFRKITFLLSSVVGLVVAAVVLVILVSVSLSLSFLSLYSHIFTRSSSHFFEPAPFSFSVSHASYLQQAGTTTLQQPPLQKRGRGLSEG